MRASVRLRPPVMDRFIAPCAAPTPHGTARSMLPLGADSYGAAASTGLLVRVPRWASQGPRLPAWGSLYPPRRAIRMGAHCWGRLYPPREAIRGPFVSPPYHIGLGDDVAPGAPATSVTYPDILTSTDQVAVPALEPTDVWVPPGLVPTYGAAPPVGAPVAPITPVFTAPGLTPRPTSGSTYVMIPPDAPRLGPFTYTQWLYGGGAALGLLFLLSLTKRRR